MAMWLLAALPPAGALARAASLLGSDFVPVGRWAEQNGLGFTLTTALWESAARPLAVRWAHALRGSAAGLWRHGYCPVCGRAPQVAEIDGNNFRHLRCGFCGTAWDCRRVGCVWCDCDDPAELRSWTAPEWAPWRVDTCDRCGGYVKTLDRFRSGPVADGRGDPILADMDSRWLDRWAEAKGYARGGRPT